jgi:hypothetical protein
LLAAVPLLLCVLLIAALLPTPCACSARVWQHSESS